MDALADLFKAVLPVRYFGGLSAHHLAGDGGTTGVIDSLRAAFSGGGGARAEGSLAEAAAQQDYHRTIRWIVIQVAAIYAFYHSVWPFLTTRSTTFAKVRAGLDVFLFLSLVAHVPAINKENANNTRFFVGVFALMSVVTWVSFALAIVLAHLASWVLRFLHPRTVDALHLPGSQRWRPPSILAVVAWSCVLSFLLTSIFTGCTFEMQLAKSDSHHHLPLICRSLPAPKASAASTTTTTTSTPSSSSSSPTARLSTIGIELSPTFSIIDTPFGLLWIASIAFLVLRLTMKRSSEYSRRTRIANALKRRMNDVMMTADSFLNLSAMDFPEPPLGGTVDASPSSILSGDGTLSPFHPNVAPSDNNTTSTTKIEETGFLPMSEWYSLTMADTVWDLLISFKLFFGRFDLRSQAEPEVDYRFMDSVDHAGNAYFDFMADTGDGGNSTYDVARRLAQPSLFVANSGGLLGPKAAGVSLPRPQLLIIGGDLVYPTPSVSEYDRRLFHPFQCALRPPPNYAPENISDFHEKREGAREVKYDGGHTPPHALIIPGNHDWFDGLSAFTRVVLNRNWLGGWRLPQTSSYFAVPLPKGWWIFGIDSGLGEDIDPKQFRFFADVAKRKVGPYEKVVLVAHEPIWLLDANRGTPGVRGPILSELIRTHIRDRLALRVAGDVHCYLRHDPVVGGGGEDDSNSTPAASVSKETPVLPARPDTQGDDTPGPLLIVSGGGGAFLHPTHSFPSRFSAGGMEYQRACAYPDVNTSRKLAFENLGTGFRLHNWKFDFVGVTLYFALVASLFPRCGVINRVRFDDVEGFYSEALATFGDMLSQGNVSLLALGVVLVASLVFTDTERRGPRLGLALGLAHGLAHVVVALFLFLLLEITVEYAVRDGVAGRSYDSLYESVFAGADPVEGIGGNRTATATLATHNNNTLTTSIRFLLRLIDLPEAIAVPRVRMCAALAANPGTSPFSLLSRGETIVYYLANFLYLSVLSADAVAAIIGFYLTLAGGLLSLHWNESFSSIRNPHYKNFIRFKIDRKGDLHGYVLGIDRTPSTWRANERAQGEEKEPSSLKSSPSRYVPYFYHESKFSSPRLVDYFKISGNFGKPMTRERGKNGFLATSDRERSGKAEDPNETTTTTTTTTDGETENERKIMALMRSPSPLPPGSPRHLLSSTTSAARGRAEEDALIKRNESSKDGFFFWSASETNLRDLDRRSLPSASSTPRPSELQQERSMPQQQEQQQQQR